MKGIKHVQSKADDDRSIRFAGDAVLRLKTKQEMPAKFVIQSVDGMLPCLVELIADPDTADLAFQDGPAIKLEICGAKIRTQIAAQNKQTHALLLFAAPFLRGLAKAMAAYDK
jgi:hypothetical protein